MKRKADPLKIKLSKAEMKRIIAKERKEFPGDFALQQVHIARDILTKKAEKAGMSDLEYIACRRKVREKMFSNRGRYE